MIDLNYQSQNSIRAKAVLWLLEKGVPIHGRLNKQRIAWGLQPDEFLDFCPGSLGHTLGLFYKTEKFEPIPRAERHDVFHVLLGYNTHVIDEAAMQFFCGEMENPLFLP